MEMVPEREEESDELRFRVIAAWSIVSTLRPGATHTQDKAQKNVGTSRIITKYKRIINVQLVVPSVVQWVSESGPGNVMSAMH